MAYSITFGTLVSAMLDLGGYWDLGDFWRVTVFGVVPPALAIAINSMGVRVSVINRAKAKQYPNMRFKFYGIIESIAGVLKLLLVLGVFVLMCVINAGGTRPLIEV
jgi:hypothetical protein